MLFKDNLGRVAMRAVAGMAAACALGALASCGGGTYQVTAFVPARILTFGDESSRLEGAQGLKYSINGISTSTLQIDCSQAPIWTQALANSYGLVYADCNLHASAETNAVDLTKVNATVDDLVDAVSAFQAGDTFNGNDIVTIWVGMHDVLGEYQSNGTGGDQSTLLSDMNGQGAKLARTVNAIAAAGAKVIVLTIPDMSYTPFAYTESQRGDFDRLKLLSDMSTQFNLGLRSNILNDGSKIGLVLVDDLVRNATRSPSSFGLIALDNQTYGCLDTAPLPTCTPDTLRDDPSTGQQATASFMWADATHLGSVMQAQIGSQAVGRAHSNPF
jgi:phospholipase/lecithinase/hemolysin